MCSICSICSNLLTLQGFSPEQMQWMICDRGNPWKYLRFIELPQIPQMLYYLNLKYKKIYKKSNIKREYKNICGICGNYWKTLV